MLDAIRRRRSIRRFTQQLVEGEKIQEILMAAMCAPSAHHLNPWDFVVVKDAALKQKLASSTDYSKFADGAPVIIVITVNAQNSLQWIEDGSIVASFIYLEATNQGLGTCWIQIYNMHTHEGEESEAYVRSVLGIPQSNRVLCIMPVGYPADHPHEHDSTSFIPAKIHRNSW